MTVRNCVFWCDRARIVLMGHESRAPYMRRVTFRNISREPLNLSVAELTERFVQGDASRHTDGNGLGLAIAMSLMKLQKGDLDIEVDGDLFKVTLRFPKG